MIPSLPPAPGQIVRVRTRQYLVEDVVLPPQPHEQTIVRLSCLEDDAQGTKLDVLWEKEVDAELLTGAAWDDVARKGFDPPDLFSAYLHTLRWNCVTATNSRLFQSPLRAGIQVFAYQLEPLRKALLLPRVNLFIADDVGLGKTIEAGLIVRELLMRQKVRRIVVCSPSSVVLQWREEMESRFGLTFAVFDRAYVSARRQERGYGINPWNTHSRFIISHALLRDEAYAAPLRDWLGDFATGTLLILDEAHNAAPASASKYAVDSQFTHVVRDVAERFEHRLFLSATPHNGHSNSFAALLEILDPQRFCRGVPIKSAKQLEPVMVRRLKADLREVKSGDFPVRKVCQIDIAGLPDDAPELRLSRLLAAYREAREIRLAGASKRIQATAGLVTISLQKRLLSSIEAFSSTLRVHRRAFERHLEPAERQLTEMASAETLRLLREAPWADDERAELSEEEVGAEEDAAMEAATAASGAGELAEPSTLGQERTLLREMAEIADEARGLPDPRVRELVAWMREHMCAGLSLAGEAQEGATWTDRRILIFTEYADTKRYLLKQLEAAIAGTHLAHARIAQFHGGMDEQAREEVKRAFNADPARHPVRILVATDAAREGLNLQAHCADLFHFDVPWNPSRMEQRNGRIDRKLQRSPVVRCYYFVFHQRDEDRVLQALVKKTATIQEELGSLSPVLEGRLAKLLEGGIAPGRMAQLETEIEKASASGGDRTIVEEELEGSRERKGTLGAQIESLRDILDTSEKALGFTSRHFRNALSAALALQGAPHLKPLSPPESAGGGVERWEFPALDEGNRSWADTLDTLRVPRRRDQKPWEWRREAPVRPVVFKDSGTLDDDAVHLHLEHRVVQRLLGQFLAQGFVRHDLSRACVGSVEGDAIPRVVLLGRLSLFGDGAARLHDEIVAVAARWSDPDLRGGPLKPYAEEAEGKALDLLEKALESPRRDAVPEATRRQLLAGVAVDVADLLGPLEARAREVAAMARLRLEDRGMKEAQAMREIIETQRKRIEETLEKYHETGQMALLGFKDDELRQLEADRKHWRKRLAAIAGELDSEPARIRCGYEVRVERIEPVGIAYLWPMSG